MIEHDHFYGNSSSCNHCAYASLSAPRIALDQVSYGYDYDGVDTNGGFVKITGVLKSNVNQEYQVSPYISVTSAHPGPFGINNAELDSLLRSHYPVYKEKGSWYFRVESNLTDPVIVRPGDRISFEIKAYPLKAGVYNPGVLLMSDEGDIFRRSYFGPSVTVTGSTMPTTGEITQAYLPLSIGAAVMFIVVLKARRTLRDIGSSSKIEKAIRLFFAVKCGLEAVWLSGVLFWLVHTGYSFLYPYEQVLGKLAGLTLILAAITAGSYFAATSKSRNLWRVIAISTCFASIAFYFLLLAGSTLLYLGYIPEPFQWRGITYGNLGYWIISAMPEFVRDIVSYSLPFIFVPPLNANLVVGIYILVMWLKERNRTTRFARQVVP